MRSPSFSFFGIAYVLIITAVDYRLAPETPFPGALHDAVASYFYLTQGLSAASSLGVPC